MLIDFTVENYRSIKEPITLSAIAQKQPARSTVKHSDVHHVMPDEEIAPSFGIEGWSFELLPVLAIFGANASGKSNVMRALDSFLDYIIHGLGNAIWPRAIFTQFLFDYTNVADQLSASGRCWTGNL